ncbi:MAG: hypothetical protein MJZ76_01420 [Bacteroidales bacterium]|nr:hypothetical protein [Bacteroidales bacterium]
MLRRCKILLFIVIISLSCNYELQAQSSHSNLRMKEFSIDSSIIRLDSASILPNSFFIANCNPSDFEVDYAKGVIKVLNDSLIGRKVKASYRTVDDLFAPKKNKSLDLISSPIKTPEQPDWYEIPATSALDLSYGTGLQSSGLISRGIMVGNNQDLSMQSSLNLQLSGMLSDDIEIMANITDKNIPIQPEGNTRLVQDFNKIFIQLNYKNQFGAKAGDIEVQRDDYFLKLNKRFLGMELFAHNEWNTTDVLSNKLGGGIAKGKFARNTIAPIDGVQGPYKLYGTNGETNLIILAGSERVFIDGQLLTRGQEFDYTIDYNTGEVTFTANRMVTKDLRIVVEFEYSDYSYSRYTLYTFNEFSHEKNSKLKLNVNFYHEQDLKNQSIQPELNDEQKLFLSALGDEINAALYASADSVEFNSNEILYNKIDSVVDGVAYSPVYVRALNGEKSCYRLKFTYLGAHRGNYILANSSANGRVFQWVAPIDDVPQGDYEPVMMLAAPKLSQMATLGARYDFLKNSGVKVEVALSNRDENTFSKKNNADNVGLATKIQFHHQNELKRRDTNRQGWNHFINLDYEFVHKNFSPIEAFREVEFKRTYNLISTNFLGHEHILSFSTGFQNDEIGKSSYDFNFYSIQNKLNAFRNELISNTKIKGWTISTQTSFLITNDSIQRTRFLKTDNLISKSFKKVSIGLIENLEYNLFRDQQNDTVRLNSYAFNEAGFFIKNGDSSVLQYNLSYKNRIDHDATPTGLALYSLAHEAQASLEINKNKNHRFRATATYRNLSLRDSVAGTTFSSENNFLGALQYTGKFFKNAIVFTCFYEVGSGQEPKRTFSFLRVADGQGTHVWKDYNGNGIEELDEFEVAVFKDEANYVKIWLQGTEYISTYNNQFTTTLQLRPGVVWSKKMGFRRFVSFFEDAVSFRTTQKSISQNWLKALNPFDGRIDDSLLVCQSLNLKNDLNFNTPNSYFGFDFIVQKTQNKSLLYYGSESNTLDLQEVVLRSNPLNVLKLKSYYSHSLKGCYSEYLASRNYQIESNAWGQTVLYNLRKSVTFDLSYLFQVKKNRLGEEKCIKNSFELSVSYRLPKTGLLNVKLQYINLNINKIANGTLSYEMLEGLQGGHNGLWTVTYETNIGDYLRLNLLYEGRVSETGKVIHTGNVQLKAYF